jgi:hypothetical protein
MHPTSVWTLPFGVATKQHSNPSSAAMRAADCSASTPYLGDIGQVDHQQFE